MDVGLQLLDFRHSRARTDSINATLKSEQFFVSTILNSHKKCLSSQYRQFKNGWHLSQFATIDQNETSHNYETDL